MGEMDGHAWCSTKDGDDGALLSSSSSSTPSSPSSSLGPESVFLDLGYIFIILIMMKGMHGDAGRRWMRWTGIDAASFSHLQWRFYALGYLPGTQIYKDT